MDKETKIVKGPSKLVNTVDAIASSVSDFKLGIVGKDDRSVVEKKPKKAKNKSPKKLLDREEPVMKGEANLESVGAIRNWLVSVQPNVPPAIAETIQGQLYVLSFVQSPAMTGMAVDNLILCLDKSLKASSSDEEKSFIRETFCSMIQNLMFVSDARLAYAVKKNREEAASLLTQAGDLLDSTISTIATITVTPGIQLPKVSNIFAGQLAKEGFFKKLGTWIGKKKELEVKKEEYYMTVVNMFKTLDRYSSLIGPSILICGMLERYRPMVLEYYQDKYRKEENRASEKNLAIVASIMIATGQLIGADSSIKKKSVLQKSGETLNQKTQYTEDDLLKTEKLLVADLAVADKEYCDIRKKEESLTAQLEKTSSLQLSRKKALKESLSELKTKIDLASEQRHLIENRLTQVREIIKQEYPRREELKKMDEDFKRITEKFAVEIE